MLFKSASGSQGLSGRERYSEVVVNRIEIEIELHRGRADAIEWVGSLSEEELRAPRTRSEHNPESWWSSADHFVHTAVTEQLLNDIVRRHLRGEKAMDPGMVNSSGTALLPADELMAWVNAFTERWKLEQEGKPLDELVRISLAVRTDTLALLADVTDEQLASKIPVAPWGDGTVGGVLSVHGYHARVHREFAEAGTPAG